MFLGFIQKSFQNIYIYEDYTICLKLKENSFVSMFVCLCVGMCSHECKCPWKPGEGVGFPGSGVTGICEPPDVVTGNQTEVFCKSSISS